MQPGKQNKAVATLSRAVAVPVLDRLIARMEVSRTYPMPMVSMLSFWAGLIGLTVIHKVTGAAPVILARSCGVAWLLVVGLELGRDMWAQRHRYASPRWLRAVDAAVGNDVTVHALAALIKRHEHDPDYVVTRSDLRFEIQAERARRRDAARRAEGFRLVETSEGASEQASVDAERRQRARARRAARRAQAPA